MVGVGERIETVELEKDDGGGGGESGGESGGDCCDVGKSLEKV